MEALIVTSPDGEVGYFLNGLLLGVEYCGDLLSTPLRISEQEFFFQQIAEATGTEITVRHVEFCPEDMPEDFQWAEDPKYDLAPSDMWGWIDVELAVYLELL